MWGVTSDRDRVDGDGWTLKAFREHVDTLLAELDRRYEQRFEGQQTGLQAALSSANAARVRAEASMERRFEGVNEFRQTLSDQANSFIPRAEAVQRADANATRIAELAERVRGLEAERTGGANVTAERNQSTHAIVAIAGLLVGAGGVAVALLG